MLKKFVKCFDEIGQTLAALKLPQELSEHDRNETTDLCNALAIFEIATDTLYRRDINLFKADKTLEFFVDVLKKLNTNIPNDLLRALVLRINERRISILVHLMRYMNDPDYEQMETDYMGYAIVRENIVKLMVDLSSRLFGEKREQNDNAACLFDSNRLFSEYGR